jgi:hypothetical protein
MARPCSGSAATEVAAKADHKKFLRLRSGGFKGIVHLSKLGPDSWFKLKICVGGGPKIKMPTVDVGNSIRFAARS